MHQINTKETIPSYQRWLVLILCFFLMAIGYSGILSIGSIFVVPVTSDLGYSRSSFMLFSSIMMLSSVVFAGLYGKTMERGNIKHILIMNMVAVFLAYFGFSKATALWHFYFCAVLLGSGFSGLSTLPVSILINRWFEEKVRGRIMSIAFTGSGLGGMLLIPFIGSIIESHGWRQGYFILGLCFLCFLIPLTLVIKLEANNSRFSSQYSNDKSRTQHTATKEGLTFPEARKTRYFWFVITALFIIILGSGALISTSAAYFSECGYSASQSAHFSGLMLGMLCIGKLLSGYVCDKYNPKIGIVSFFATFSLCFLFLFLLPNYPSLIYPIIITFGIGAGSITIAPPLLVSSLFGEKDYGMLLGVLTMSVNISVAIGSLLASTIYDITSSYTPYWLFSTFGSIISTSFIYISFSMKEKSHNQSVSVHIENDTTQCLLQK